MMLARLYAGRRQANQPARPQGVAASAQELWTTLSVMPILSRTPTGIDGMPDGNGKQAMARPKEFDQDEALAQAIAVFTAHGYAGASTEALREGMRISRQSMYDTFGDKRSLYLAALQRYCSDSTAEIIGTMHSRATARDGVEAALLAFASRPAQRPEDGCLGVAAASEFGQSDAQVGAITHAAGATLQSAFERIVRKGQAEGDFGAELDPRVAAQFLAATLSGLKLAARSGAPQAMLKGIVHFALRGLR